MSAANKASLKEVNGIVVDADLQREDWSVDWGFIEKVNQGNIYGKVIRGEIRHLMVTGSRAGAYQLAWLGNEDLNGWSLLGKCTYLREDGEWRMLYASGKRQVGLWLYYNGWKPCEITVEIKENE